MTITEDRPASNDAAEVGKARTRKEDQRLITGRTKWTDNIQLPGMLHLAMVRSPYAHATITNIEVAAARAADGVIAVFTGADLADNQGVNINAWPITADQVTPTHLPVPADRVAHTGEIVAVVVARSAARARDAAELVDVDYDELPAVLDMKEALTDAVLAHPDLGTNKSAFWKLDSKEGGTGGDVDEAIAKAREDGIVIEREYRQQRLIPAFMEPRRTSCASPSRRRPACRSPRSGSSPRTSVVASAASSRPRPRSSPPWRSPASSASPASSPRPAPRPWSPGTTAATSGRR